MKKILMILVIMICAMDVFAQKNPVFNNGFQYELEAGTFGGSMAFSYKFAKRFSFGAGYWYGVYYWDSNNINKYVGDSYIQNITTNYNYFSQYNLTDRVITSTSQQGRPNSRMSSKMFLTGQIRPINTWFSLLLGANVGYETIQLDDYWYPHYGDKQQVFFVTPFTGFSFRMKNFYINLKGGVNMDNKIKPEDKIVVQEENLFFRDGYLPGTKQWVGGSTPVGKQTTTIELPDIDISSLYAVMNFTWTLNFGHGYREKQRIIAYRNEHPKVKKYRDGHVLNTIVNVLDGVSQGMSNTANELNGYYQNNYPNNYNTGTISGNNGQIITSPNLPTSNRIFCFATEKRDQCPVKAVFCMPFPQINGSNCVYIHLWFFYDAGSYLYQMEDGNYFYFLKKETNSNPNGMGLIYTTNPNKYIKLAKDFNSIIEVIDNKETVFNVPISESEWSKESREWEIALHRLFPGSNQPSEFDIRLDQEISDLEQSIKGHEEEINRLNRIDLLCQQYPQHYLEDERLLREMYLSDLPYDDVWRKSLQSEMKQIRNNNNNVKNCPSKIKESNMETWMETWH